MAELGVFRCWQPAKERCEVVERASARDGCGQHGVWGRELGRRGDIEEEGLTLRLV